MASIVTSEAQYALPVLLVNLRLRNHFLVRMTTAIHDVVTGMPLVITPEELPANASCP